MVLRLFLLVFGSVNVVLGFATIVSPDLLLVLLDTDTKLSVSAMNETRASYGGMYLTLGLFALYGSYTGTWMRGALMLILVSCTGNIVGRIFSFFLDGIPGSAAVFVFLAAELVFVLYAAIMLRKTRWVIAGELADSET